MAARHNAYHWLKLCLLLHSSLHCKPKPKSSLNKPTTDVCTECICTVVCACLQRLSTIRRYGFPSHLSSCLLPLHTKDFPFPLPPAPLFLSLRQPNTHPSLSFLPFSPFPLSVPLLSLCLFFLFFVFNQLLCPSVRLIDFSSAYCWSPPPAKSTQFYP